MEHLEPGSLKYKQVFRRSPESEYPGFMFKLNIRMFAALRDRRLNKSGSNSYLLYALEIISCWRSGIFPHSFMRLLEVH